MNEPSAPSPQASRPHTLYLLLAALAVGVVAYLGAIGRGIEVWSSSPDEQHGFLVLPLALLLLYLRRGERPREGLGIDLRGLVLIAIAGGMRIYSELDVRPWMDLWSLPIWIGGVVWLFGGWKLFRWSALPIAFLFFMAPLPGQVQTLAGYPLQRIAATGGGWLLQVMGQPAFVSGTTILLGENILEVERACAGLRMFHGMLAVAVGWCLYSRYRWPRFSAMLAIAPLVAIFVNVLRIAVTGLLYQYVSGDAARTFTHDWAGLVMIPTGAVIFFLIDSLSDRLFAWTSERSDRWLMVGSGTLVAVLAIGIGGYYLHQSQQEKTIGLVLEEARRLVASEDEEDLQTGIQLMQQYLMAREDDAAVYAELAEVNLSMGRTQAARAAMLFQQAWKLDPTRTEDAVKAANIIAGLGAYSDLWERCNEFLPETTGEARRTLLRLRTDSVGEMERFSLTGVDAEDRFAAVLEGQREDPEYFPHLLQMVQLVSDDPGLLSEEQLIAWIEGLSLPEEAPYPLDAETLEREKPWREMVDGGSDTALRLIDHMVAAYPEAAEPLLYRSSFLAGLRPPAAGPTELDQLEADRNTALDRALAVVERWELPAGEELSPDDERRRAVAANVYLTAGERALADADEDTARALLQKSVALRPSNFRVYLRLAETLPREAYDQRIALFSKAVEQTAGREITLLLPLAEAYLASGREAEATKLLAPLRAELPELSPAVRGRIELMLASSEGTALALQNKLEAATRRIEQTCARAEVQEFRDGFPELYARAQFQLGALYRRMNRESAAKAAFREGGRFDANSPVRRLDAAMAYEAAGNRSAALQEYQQVARMVGRQQPDVYLAIARNLLASVGENRPSDQQLEPVRKLIRDAAGAGADVNQAATLMAESYRVQGNPEGAIQVLDEQIAKHPDLPGLLFSKALILQGQGNDEAALQLVSQYTAAGATPAEALLLKILLLIRGERLPKAIETVTAAEARLSDEQLKDARTQVALATLTEGQQADAAIERLTQLADTYPDDVTVQRLAGTVLSELRQYEAVKKAEDNLRRLEEEGTTWREIRAERLLLTATSQANLDEAAKLVTELKQLLPDSPRTTQLEGVLASRRGNWAEAARLLQASWDAGQRDSQLSIQLLTALNRIGQSERAAALLQQLEDVVPRSTALFDRAVPQLIDPSSRQDVIALARRFFEEDPSPENKLRLAETLVTVVAASRDSAANDFDSPDLSEEDRAQLDEAEVLLNQLIEASPDDLTAWIALFRLYAQGRGEREQALQQLARLETITDIPELDRQFVMAQLYSRVDEGARAGRLFEECLRMAAEREVAEAAVVQREAAEFFRDRRPERAIEILRELAASEAALAIEAENRLIGLLLARGTVESIDEAIGVHNDPDPVTIASEPLAKRIQVELLLAREQVETSSTLPDSIAPPADAQGITGQVPAGARLVSLQQPGEDATGDSIQWLRQAAELIRSISPMTAGDHVLLARILDRQDQVTDALREYQNALRLAAASPQRLIEFVDFWNRRFAAENQYAAIADRFLGELAAQPGQAGAWLRLRLQRAAIQRQAAGEEADSQAPQQIPSDEQILAEFRAKFLTANSGQPFIDLVSQNLVGISQAGRYELIGPALDALRSEASQPNEVTIAAAITALQATDAPAASGPMLDWLVQQPMDSGEGLVDAVRLTGDACYVNGRFEAAIPYYRRAIELDPEDDNVKNSLAFVLAENGGDSIDESLRIVSQLIDDAPDDRSLFDTRLIVAVLDDRWDMAREAESQLTDVMDASTLLHRAYLEWKQGEPKAARTLFEMARDGRVTDNLLAPVDRDMYRELSKQFIES